MKTKMANELKFFTKKLQLGSRIGYEDADRLFKALIEEKEEDLLTAFFTAWNAKGIDATEIAAFASVMRKRMIRVEAPNGKPVADIVGTGGSSKKTFNVSTAAAIVAASAGVVIAKHGNRAATGKSGSVDVLESLKINLPRSAPDATKDLNNHSLAFLAAPYFHRLSPTLANVRRSLGFPTIFNCVGPICNPASPRFQLIGARNRETAESIALALFQLGGISAWVVNSGDAYDEISAVEPSDVFEVSANGVNRFSISPRDFAILPAESFPPTAEGPQESAELIISVLRCQKPETAEEKLVLMNCASLIFITGNAGSLAEAYKIAEKALRSGAALNKLREISSRTDL